MHEHRPFRHEEPSQNLIFINQPGLRGYAWQLLTLRLVSSIVDKGGRNLNGDSTLLPVCGCDASRDPYSLPPPASIFIASLLCLSLSVASNGDTGAALRKIPELVHGNDIRGSGSTYSHLPTVALQNQ
jgi:hypothetical protein